MAGVHLTPATASRAPAAAAVLARIDLADPSTYGLLTEHINAACSEGLCPWCGRQVRPIAAGLTCGRCRTDWVRTSGGWLADDTLFEIRRTGPAQLRWESL